MLPLSNIGRILIILGVLFFIIGGFLIVLDHIGLSKWKIPGDIHAEWGSFTCVIALGTSLLLSILITIILNVLVHFLNR